MVGEKKDKLFNYNDYELLYMASDDSGEAIDILLKKYQYLVLRIIKDFNVEQSKREDFLQEGLLMINKAIKTYKINSKMTFTKYVEMLVNHRFIDMLRKKQNEKIMPLEDFEYVYVVNETPKMLSESSIYDYNGLSKFEQKIYNLRFLEGKTYKEISEMLGVNVKQIYSAVDRIKKKRCKITI